MLKQLIFVDRLLLQIKKIFLDYQRRSKLFLVGEGAEIEVRRPETNAAGATL